MTIFESTDSRIGNADGRRRPAPLFQQKPVRHRPARLVFDNPDNVYGFVSMANDNEFFNGRSPLAIMAQGDMVSLYETFRRIDMLRGALW
jgi:hypothetical protein